MCLAWPRKAHAGRTGEPKRYSGLGKIVKDYHINIFYGEEDEGYIADIPDLEYCSAFGSSPKEALEEVLKAKEAWLETAKKKGKVIPKPTFRPLIYQAA